MTGLFDFANPSIAAAWIGTFGMAAGGLIGWFSSHTLRRESHSQRSNLQVQLDGWRTFSEELQDRLGRQATEIRNLSARIEECERDRIELWRRIRQNEGDE